MKKVICDHAGECRWSKGYCYHGKRHKVSSTCDDKCGYDPAAKCVEAPDDAS